MEAFMNFFAGAGQFQDLSLFFLRLVAGFMFTYSGVTKIQRVKAFSKGINLPPAIGLLVILAELVGGIGLILGLFTKLAALFIMIVMVGSMYKHIFVWQSPYWATHKGWEYDLTWFMIAFVILTTGGGSLAVFPYF